MTRVLVTYDSKYGATEKIAEAIGNILTQTGYFVDVMPVQAVTYIDIYDAFVIGSAVYMGQWRKAATKFLREHEAFLATRDVWLFSSGPTGDGDPVLLLDGWYYPDRLKAVIGRIRPNDIAVFHGSLEITNLNFIERYLVKTINASLGDYRDWEAIESWAREISELLAVSLLHSYNYPEFAL